MPGLSTAFGHGLGKVIHDQFHAEERHEWLGGKEIVITMPIPFLRSRGRQVVATVSAHSSEDTAPSHGNPDALEPDRNGPEII